jgi:hypothetical protein
MVNEFTFNPLEGKNVLADNAPKPDRRLKSRCRQLPENEHPDLDVPPTSARRPG